MNRFITAFGPLFLFLGSFAMGMAVPAFTLGVVVSMLFLLLGGMYMGIVIEKTEVRKKATKEG